MQHRRLTVVYILPSRYDDEGYVHRYWRGILPSNTLSVLRRLTEDAAEQHLLGEDIEVSVETFDDSVQRPPLNRIIRRHKRGEPIVVGIAGVQSNQFPRATDIAKRLRDAGVPVLMGGFHVSGVLAVFGSPSAELQEMLDRGVTLIRGEVESPGVLAGILRDAMEGRHGAIHSILEPPDISHAPVPIPNREYMRRFVFKNMGTIDTSRGCPFNCSFCSIINVQGRRMRGRSAGGMLEAIEQNLLRGVNVYFFTDDNLSRSPVWEELFDGLSAMRARGAELKFMMQVDTQAWKIPGFLEKARAAGAYLVFVGMESINPENLAAVGKRQNKVDQYAEMVDAWHRAGVLVHVGYIIGFPHDSVTSVRHDLAVLMGGIRVDEASFFMLTPIPGSRDHRRMVETKTPVDADLNNFDSFHETFHHPLIPAGQWYGLYKEAWETFYSKEHMVNVLLRTETARYWQVLWLLMWNRYSTLLGSHPMITGLFRMKDRCDRRPGFAREGRLRYIRRRSMDSIRLAGVFVRLFFEFQEIWLLTRREGDPRWKTLAALRSRWAESRCRLLEYDLAGRRDAAVQELRGMLAGARDQLEQVAAAGWNLGARAKRKLAHTIEEIDGYIHTLDVSAPTWQQVAQIERYVGEGLVAGYENLAIRYVARRRQFNAYRREMWSMLKTGRILTLNISPIPRLLFFELAVGLRFGLAFLIKG